MLVFEVVTNNCSLLNNSIFVTSSSIFNYLNVTIICRCIFLRILDSKHFTGIKFCVLFWVLSNLMIFIVLSPTNQYLGFWSKLQKLQTLVPAKICNTKVYKTLNLISNLLLATLILH